MSNKYDKIFGFGAPKREFRGDIGKVRAILYANNCWYRKFIYNDKRENGHRRIKIENFDSSFDIHSALVKVFGDRFIHAGVHVKTDRRMGNDSFVVFLKDEV